MYQINFKSKQNFIDCDCWMGYENEDDFIAGIRNLSEIFGWAAKFFENL